MHLNTIPDSDIAEVVVQKFNNCTSDDFLDLFHESAKLTIEATRKEGKTDIANEIRKLQEKNKGEFQILKFRGVEINENSKIYSGVAQWGSQNYIITTCLEPETDDNLIVTNLMLLNLK